MMDLVAKKIREFEAKNADEHAKAQKQQKGRAKNIAKAKMKEVKQVVDSSEVSGEEKCKKLWKLMQDEQDVTMKLSARTEAERREIEEMERDRDNCKQELNKITAMKDKLESLCRQLQQQTKALADETKQLTDNERLRRQELADEFQNTIGDVKVKMDQQAQERTQQARENEELRSRFKQFFERYDKREKELLEQQKQHEEEIKVFEGKLSEQVQLYRREASREATAKRENEALVETDKVLRTQLKTYSDKFSQFQEALSKSDKVFGQYNRQRNKMQRRVETLEKENAELRPRNEKRLAVATRERDNLLREKETLQERCKQLQQTRQRMKDDIAALQGS